MVEGSARRTGNEGEDAERDKQLVPTSRRHEFIATNPISLVRQSSVRQKEPEVLNPEEVSALLEELDEPFRTIVYLAAVTGMRRGELFGLKWRDVYLPLGQLKVVRSIVDQKVGETKTRGSKRPLPLPTEAVVALSRWKDATQYGGKDNWVFASPHAFGELPYWPNAVMVRHVQPAADRAGMSKQIIRQKLINFWRRCYKHPAQV